MRNGLRRRRCRSSTLGDVEAHNHRVEQRGLSMLLAALPDPIRREIISAWMMSATEIMFRLHQVYQPGGTSERGNLLRHLTDPKAGTNLCDALQTLRLWRRWLARAEELDVALPDGLALITVLGKIAEVVGKTGAQASFRISSVRQELQIDIRPQIGKIKQFAEYLQAEAEELLLTTAIKAASTSGTTGTGTHCYLWPEGVSGSGSQGDGQQKEAPRPCLSVLGNRWRM